MTEPLVMQLLSPCSAHAQCISAVWEYVFCDSRNDQEQGWMQIFRNGPTWLGCVCDCKRETVVKIALWESRCPLIRSKSSKELAEAGLRSLSRELCCLETWLNWMVLGFLAGSLWSGQLCFPHLCLLMFRRAHLFQEHEVWR